jgi:hypothetical protein
MKSKLSPNTRKNRIINDLVETNNCLRKELNAVREGGVIIYEDGKRFYVIEKWNWNELWKEQGSMTKLLRECLEYKAKYFQLIKTIKI